MNKIILIGRVTRDIDLRYTISNTPVAQFTLAVPRNFKNQDGEYDTDFINCVQYGKQAETTKEYVLKGDLLAVDGRLQVRNYENSEGKNVYVTEVIVERVQFLAQKKKEELKEEPKKESDPFAEFSSQIELTDDDIAF